MPKIKERVAGSIIVAAAVLCASCTSIAPPVPLAADAGIRPGKTEANATGLDPYIAFNKALAAAQSSTDGSLQIGLLNQGLALVNYRCNQYFAALGAAEQDLRFTRKQTSLTSGVVLPMLGLANATPKAIANVGSLFSFGVASMDSYQDVYIFSPDVKAVQRLVLDALGSYRERLSTVTADQLNYTWVIDRLSEYESFCQPHGIRDLVNQSLAQSTTSGETKPPTVPPAGAAPPAGAVPPAGAAPSVVVAPAGGQQILAVPRISVKVVPRQ